ncbi:MAG TPA: iron-sulfur cluster carrier protein MrpORP [Syntrophales bacterium]|nr:iron-sulfur cluster carrier protein MrpORP [Syntrophales bacterium]
MKEKESAEKTFSCRSEKELEEERKLEQRLSRIRRKIVVLSGKGGVGKSTVAVNLAVALMKSGKRVGLLDVDIHGPSIPTMLGLEQESVQGSEGEIFPVALGNLKILSMGFFLADRDDAVIWRGPMKMGVIKQFLKDVAWGDLDYLIVDSPPGTGDEPLSVIQLLGKVDGAVIVTTPQKVAAVDVRKSISFCRRLGVPVIGVIENMSGFACPHCGKVTPVLSSGGGREIARDMKVPFLGAIPMDPKIVESGDRGLAFIDAFADAPAAESMREIISRVEAADGGGGSPVEGEKTAKEDGKMRVAIPLADGRLAMHFGHCERFAIIDVDVKGKKILMREDVNAPPHEPGLLPRWLGERGAELIIAGGMGSRAQGLFAERGIRVMTGAPADTPEKVVHAWLDGTLVQGENVCDH